MAYQPARFLHGQLPAGTPPSYTVPPGLTAVITQVSLSATADAPSTSVYVASDVPNGGCLAASLPLPGGGQRRFQGFYVCPPGATLFASGSTDVWVHATGLLGTGMVDGGVPVRVVPPAVTAAGPVAAYTVPTGSTFIIKTLVATNLAPTPNYVTTRIGLVPIATAAAALAPAGAAGSTLQIDGSFVALAGEQLMVEVGAASAAGVSFYLAGVLV